jgi:ring-1,2-phenylacetyl-CoA epoxidase subunit PaaD
MKAHSEIWDILEKIPDPEIPVISIVDLGVVRGVEKNAEGYVIQITPTYSGCPAMNAIQMDIHNTLQAKGILNFKIEMVYTPAWSSNWMSAEAREQLRAYGIAPPNEQIKHKLNVLTGDYDEEVKCPHCGSEHTSLTSQFGSTACKALYKCNQCLEPFDYFKCH